MAVDLSGFLSPGEAFHIQDATDFYGASVLDATYIGGTVAVPMPVTAYTPDREFGAFVVLKEAASAALSLHMAE